MQAIARRAAEGIESERRVPPSVQVFTGAAPHLPRADAGHRIELTSRGDRVPFSIWLPARHRGGEAALAFLQPGAGAAADEAHGHAVSALLQAGLAVATVDWPLHGRRASPKLTRTLLDALDREDPGPDAGPLVEQFVVQAAIDLSRAIDAASTIDGIDSARLGLVGVGLGAHLSALVASLDPRPGALVLAPTRRGTAGLRLDAGPLLASVRAKRVLLLASREAPAVPASEVEALRHACPAEAGIEWIGGALEPLSTPAAEAAARFLEGALA